MQAFAFIPIKGFIVEFGLLWPLDPHCHSIYLTIFPAIEEEEKQAGCALSYLLNAQVKAKDRTLWHQRLWADIDS